MADEVDVGAFKPGSIVRIAMKNFLTYKDVVVHPGPRLNMAVGANGTGKSTILNGICLGLGGDPKILGRADDLKSFIMHDEEVAEIEIELAPFPGQEAHVIRRMIDRSKGADKGRGHGASTFYLNGEKAKIQDIRDLVTKTYRIAVDNLCTFLPQDKVGSFSGLNDQQRLIETEKTLSGSDYLYQTHQALVEAEDELSNSGGNVQTLQDRLKKLEHENEQLEREKERMEERERAEKQADLLRKKRLWQEFDALREEALGIKEQKAKVKDEVKAAQALLQPLRDKHERLARERRELESKGKELQEDESRKQKEMEKQSKKFENHDDEIEKIKAELLAIDSQRMRQEEEVKKATERLQNLEETQANMPSIHVVDAELQEASDKFRSIRQDYDKAKREERSHLDELRGLEEEAKSLQNKLAHMKDHVARRKDHIFRHFGKLRQIHEWLEKNQRLFRRPVVGPILCEVAVQSKEVATLLEFHVPNSILQSFVTETKEDYDKLYNVVRKEMQLPINIVNVKKVEQIKRPYSDDKMNVLRKDHDIQGFLDEFVTGPDVVLQALRTHAQIHQCLVGGARTQHSIDQKDLLSFLSSPDLSLGQTANQKSCVFSSKEQKWFRYTQTVSKYSKQLNSRQDDLSPAKLLDSGVDERQKKEVEKALSAVHGKVEALRPELHRAQQNVNNLQSETQGLKLKVDAAKQTKQNYTTFQGKVERARAKLRDAEKDLQKDDQREKEALVRELMKRVAHSITAMDLQADQLDYAIRSNVCSAAIMATKHTIAAAERCASQAVKDMNEQFAELVTKADAIHKKYEASKKRLAEVRQAAQRHAPLTDENGNDSPLKIQLEELEPSTLEEIDAALEEAEQKINAIHANPDVVRQYELRKIEIQETKAKLEQQSRNDDRKREEIESTRKKWESMLDNCTSKINIKFSEYMSEMGFTGEVRLYKGEGTNDRSGNFKQWGMQILVSYRSEGKAHILSAQRHSGGERSVATILYLMALQDMMVAPFRCVDEINQGLDERNERLVFRRIVANSTQKPKSNPIDHSGQYFLITPKLLPNLEDMENEGVTVLFVMNGQYNFLAPDKWDVDALLGIRRKKRTLREGTNEDLENNTNSVRPRVKKKSRRPLSPTDST